jgi:NAD(P)-dependent dehydrogenase (short-subunit alcohol dehydrogenase family)
MQLDGKVAIVTGGARGIGEGIARALAAQGAKVALFDLDGPAAEATANSIGNGAKGLAVDCAEEDAVQQATDDIAASFGRLDIFVNNAGAGRGPMDPALFTTNASFGSGIASQSAAAWDETLMQNLRTTFVGSKAAIPHIEKQGGGVIVNIASIAGLGASPSLAAYAAAKAGVINLTQSLALELGPKNIRVNAICPGFLYTRAWEGMATAIKLSNPTAFADKTPRDIFLESVKRATPLGREQTPADIGNLAAFLASSLAENITGQWISVDGGITLR